MGGTNYKIYKSANETTLKEGPVDALRYIVCVFHHSEENVFFCKVKHSNRNDIGKLFGIIFIQFASSRSSILPICQRGDSISSASLRKMQVDALICLVRGRLEPLFYSSRSSS